MHRTTVNIPDDIFQQARIKALRERIAVGEVIREFLDRWVGGELDLVARPPSREERVALARRARGMWADRDPDAYLAASRSGLQDRDEELEHARLAL